MPRWAVVAIRQRRPVIVTCLASAGGGDVDRMDLLGHSTPSARHSQNIAARPEVAIVVFDSTVRNEEAQAVYMEATASQTDEGIERLSAASVAAGGEAWTADEVTGAAKHRLYRADVKRCWMLGAEEERVEVKL